MTRCLMTISLLIALQLAAPLWAEDNRRWADDRSTTWFVVRHADRQGQDDALAEAGVKRASDLCQLMRTLRVNAVYSTDTQRTRRTAIPTATTQNVPVQTYGKLTAEWFEQLKSRHQGDTVLIVGHSNTVGPIVNGLGASGDFSIDDDEYDSLFIVTTDQDKVSAVQIRFGEPP